MGMAASVHRPFRFSVQEHHAESARQWRKRAQAIESMGYSALYLPDHFGDQPGPIAALMAAADATTKLRIGFGLGAGWLVSDYEQAGLPYDPAAIRIDRLEEALTIIKRLFTGKPFSFTGKHYSVKELEGSPLPVQKPHPRLLLGGGGRRMLRLAARDADIVHVNYNLNEGRINPKLVRTGLAEATDEKLGWIKEAAGDRFDSIELGFTVFFATVTDDRESVAAAMAPSMNFEPRDVLEMPHFLIGTIDQIEEDLKARRDRYGFSDVIVPGDAADALAPVVEHLAGR